MENEIHNFCIKVCCKEVGMQDELIVSGLLNSYDLMELISILHERFSIEFSIEEITETNNFSTVDNLIKIVKNKIQ